jgi:hypothetical protein
MKMNRQWKQLTRGMMPLGLVATGLLMTSVSPLAQTQTCNATGTCGHVSAPRMTGSFVVPLVNQERETPVVNNITNVTQQVTQVVPFNTYLALASGGGTTSSAAYADCGGGKLVSGGVECRDGSGAHVAPRISRPNGNGWYAACHSIFAGGAVSTNVTAICTSN